MRELMGLSNQRGRDRDISQMSMEMRLSGLEEARLKPRRKSNKDGESENRSQRMKKEVTTNSCPLALRQRGMRPPFAIKQSMHPLVDACTSTSTNWYTKVALVTQASSMDKDEHSPTARQSRARIQGSLADRNIRNY